jgi:hypothetical protein
MVNNVFLQLCLIDLFGTKKAYLHLIKHKLQELLLSKTNSTLTGKQCARCCSSNTDCFLWRDTCVSATQLNGPFWNKVLLLNLEKPVMQEVFIAKLTQFSQGSNVLYATASNTKGFLLRDACISSI